MSNTKTLTVEEAQAQVKAANLALQEAIAAQFDKVKNEFCTDFLAAAKSFLAIPESNHHLVWNDKELVKAAKKIGLKPIDFSIETEPAVAGVGTGKRRGRYDEPALVAFIGEGKPQSEVQAHFGVSNPTMLAWGKKLVAAGLIKIEDDKTNKTQNFWRKV